MRLQRVPEPPNFAAVCLKCRQMIEPGTAKVADLDGPAFKAYYHISCITRNMNARYIKEEVLNP